MLWVALSAGSTILMVQFSFLNVYINGSLVSANLICYQFCGISDEHTKGRYFGEIPLPANEAAKLMMDHVSASLYFSRITYTLGNCQISQWCMFQIGFPWNQHIEPTGYCLISGGERQHVSMACKLVTSH